MEFSRFASSAERLRSVTARISLFPNVGPIGSYRKSCSHEHAWHWSKFTACFLAPLGFFAYLLYFLYEAPPFWSWYSDPTYPYLLNGVQLVTGGVPGHTDHPGTSLQWFSGATSAAIHSLFDEGGTLASAVVQDPERYLLVMSVLLAAGTSAAMGFFGYRLATFLSPRAGLLAVLLVLAASTLTLPYTVLLTPESIVLSAGLVAMAVLAPSLRGRSQAPGIVALMGLGVIAAVGVTSKVIFLPFILLLPFLLRIRSLFIVGAAMLVSVGVILLPIRSRFTQMAHWFLGVASHTNRYGDAATPAEPVWKNLVTAISTSTNAYPAGVIAIITCLLFLGFCFRGRRSNGWSKRLPVVVGLGTAVILTLAIGYKSSTDRDFVLLAVFIPTLAAITYVAFAESTDLNTTAWSPGVLGPVILLGAALLATIAVVSSQAKIRELSAQVAADQASLNLIRRQSASAWTAYTYGVPTLSNSLLFGAHWAGTNFFETLAKSGGQELDFDIWNKEVRGWGPDGQPKSFSCDELDRLLVNGGLSIVAPSAYRDMVLDQGSGSVLLANGSRLTPKSIVPERSDSQFISIHVGECIDAATGT